MTTDIVLTERALIVMAVCLAIQTLMMLGGGLAAFFAYRNAKAAVDEKMVELQARIDRISVTVDDAVSAVKRATGAVGDVVDDARDAIGRVRHGVASVASVAAAPRTAVAIGVLRGVQWWRRRRAAERLAAGGV